MLDCKYKANHMYKLYNLLGWGSTGTSLFVNATAALNRIEVNDVFTIVISVVSLIFVCMKVYKTLGEIVNVKAEKEKLNIELQILKQQYVKEDKSLDSKDSRDKSEKI